MEIQRDLLDMVLKFPFGYKYPCFKKLHCLFQESHWTSWTEWECNEEDNILKRNRSCPTKAYLTLPTCPYQQFLYEVQPCEGNLWKIFLESF